MRQAMEEQTVNLSELIRRAQAGDISGYEQIVRRFQASAFSQAFSRLGDSHLAEDAVQDAFVEAYRKLGTLRKPEAFASWFHRIVLTACSRIVRRKNVPTSPIEAAERIADTRESPVEQLEREQREQSVHQAIQALPDSLRTVTALFYIGGISQHDIAEYLGLTETSVKKRLFDARKRLKEDITNMAQKISDNKTPPELVSARVIAELVSRPQPLLIPDHPLRRIFEQVKKTLRDYEVIESREVEERDIYTSIKETFSIYPTYNLDATHVLRRETTGATFRAIKGRAAPVCLLTAGRVFRPEQEDEGHLKVFHQLDGICVSRDATEEQLQQTVKEVINAVLGTSEVRFNDADYGWLEHGWDVDVKPAHLSPDEVKRVQKTFRGDYVEVAGCGMLKVEMLKEAGFDPRQVKGYAFGMGLERLALLKLGLKNIQDLWRPPYVTLG